MTVSEFIRRKTEFGQLVTIRDKGVIKGNVWINENNTALVPIQYSNDYVRKDSWGLLKVINQDGQSIEIPCRYIDV